MPKQYNIKWRIKDERELAKVARDFNRKLDRLVQENPKYGSVFPEFYNESTQQLESYLTVEGLKELISSRKDYNRMVSMLKRFMVEGAEEIVDAPGNEYGGKLTKWQVQEMQKREKITNVSKEGRLEKLQNLEMEIGEGKLGYTLGERFGMGLASRKQLNPTKAFTPYQGQKDFHYKFFSLLKQSSTGYYERKDKELKETFIREMERNYNSTDVSDVISAIRRMNNETFVLKFEAHGDGMEQVYPPERDTPEYWANVEELKRYWLDDFALPPTAEVTATLLNQ